MARVVISGYMIRYPLAGSQLAYFHYLLGLARLGHEVVYIEESGWPDSCYDPFTNSHTSNPEAGMRSLKSICRAFGLDCPIIYVDRDSGATFGADHTRVESYLANADLWLNIGGVCSLPVFELCRRRALVDMDPMFTQIGKFGGGDLDFYHAHFTYGTNIGAASCDIPTLGVDWLPLMPPVVPDVWAHDVEAQDRPRAPFTTIANWSAYGGVEWQGRLYGQKDQEFLRVADLPGMTSPRFVLALSGEGEAVRRDLQGRGWSVVKAADVSRELDAYQRFICGSAAEFSVAKHAYVVTRSGWVSDRSVCYLAAGLPVIVQDTGIGDSVDVGRGMLVFSSLEEAVAAVDRVCSEYPQQRAWAREVAREVFDYRQVLPHMLDAAIAGGAPGNMSKRDGIDGRQTALSGTNNQTPR